MPSPKRPRSSNSFSTGSASVSLSMVDAFALAAITATGFWAGDGRQAKLSTTKLAMAKATALRRGTESIKTLLARTAFPPHPVRELSQNALRESCSRTGESSSGSQVTNATGKLFGMEHGCERDLRFSRGAFIGNSDVITRGLR